MLYFLTSLRDIPNLFFSKCFSWLKVENENIVNILFTSKSVFRDDVCKIQCWLRNANYLLFPLNEMLLSLVFQMTLFNFSSQHKDPPHQRLSYYNNNKNPSPLWWCSLIKGQCNLTNLDILNAPRQQVRPHILTKHGISARKSYKGLIRGFGLVLKESS